MRNGENQVKNFVPMGGVDVMAGRPSADSDREPFEIIVGYL